MSYGATRDPWDEREDQLSDWTDASGQGIMGLESVTLPPHCNEFILSQFARFGFPMPEIVHQLIDVAMDAVIYVVDVMDPYALFWGSTDVHITEDWTDHTYVIDDGHHAREASVERLETFVFASGQDQVIFDHAMHNPGLEALPNELGVHIVEALDGCTMAGGDGALYLLEQLKSHVREALQDLCRGSSGRVDQKRLMNYFELAAWAGYLWLSGPYARTFRADHHEIFRVCYKFGEAILHEGVILPPTSYQKIPRPPRSCYKCGISAWCIEPTLTGTTFHHICEGCLSAGMPSYDDFTCGTKRCQFVSCPNHPNRNFGKDAYFSFVRRNGALHGISQGVPPVYLPPAPPSGLLRLGPPA